MNQPLTAVVRENRPHVPRHCTLGNTCPRLQQVQERTTHCLGRPEDAAQERHLRQACAALEQCLRAGCGCRAESFLTAVPTLASDEESALEVIYTEFVLREALGQQPSPEEYYQRFPQWRCRLERQFQLHHFLRPLPSSEAGRSSLETDWPLAHVVRAHWLDQYELLAEVSHGAAIVVYQARQLGTDRLAALKVLLPHSPLESDYREAFQREMEVGARLRHPGIVRVYAAGEHAGLPYLTREFLEGGSLASHLGGRPRSCGRAARLVQTLAEAIGCAHDQGIVHCDLNPNNILLTADARPKIADFGIARQLGDAEDAPIQGTPSYMAPEQAAGRFRDIGPHTDIYGLGAILYELLTGRPPYRGETLLETLRQVQFQAPVPPSALRPGVPLALETICLQCLHKDPCQRFPSARVLADHLATLAASPAMNFRSLTADCHW